MKARHICDPSVLQKRACVYNKEGKNITKEFLDGAEKFLDFTLRGGFEEVWLKAGVNMIILSYFCWQLP